MFDLRFSTPKAWLDVVFSDFDAFLIDHAACERKASATGMSFVVRYPDKAPLIEPLIEFAREELRALSDRVPLARRARPEARRRLQGSLCQRTARPVPRSR